LTIIPQTLRGRDYRMELPRLAAKQKRYKDILEFAHNEVTDPGVKPSLLKALANYRSALTKCWDAQKIAPEDLLNIDSIERELDALQNQARLRSNAP
jgi:hypothetical protein